MSEVASQAMLCQISQDLSDLDEIDKQESVFVEGVEVTFVQRSYTGVLQVDGSWTAMAGGNLVVSGLAQCQRLS